MTRAGDKLYKLPDPDPVDWKRIVAAIALVAAVVLFAASVPGFDG